MHRRQNSLNVQDKNIDTQLCLCVCLYVCGSNECWTSNYYCIFKRGIKSCLLTIWCIHLCVCGCACVCIHACMCVCDCMCILLCVGGSSVVSAYYDTKIYCCGELSYLFLQIRWCVCLCVCAFVYVLYACVRAVTCMWTQSKHSSQLECHATPVCSCTAACENVCVFVCLHIFKRMWACICDKMGINLIWQSNGCGGEWSQ